MNIYVLSPEKRALLKRTIAKDLTDEELDLFLEVAQRQHLDPFAKQIIPTKRNQRTLVGDEWMTVKVMVIQVTVDGYRARSDETGDYAPGRLPEFAYDEKTGKLVSATAYINKWVHGAWVEVGATAYFDEFAQKNNKGEPLDMWQRMPHNQLAKCAECLCHRKGFPKQNGELPFEDEPIGEAEAVEGSYQLMNVTTPGAAQPTTAQPAAPAATTSAPQAQPKLTLPPDNASRGDKLGWITNKAFKELAWTPKRQAEWLQKNFRTTSPSMLQNGDVDEAITMLNIEINPPAALAVPVPVPVAPESGIPSFDEATEAAV